MYRKILYQNILNTIKKQSESVSPGYRCIPLQDPDAADDEMERAVTKLGFKAVMVNENKPELWLPDQTRLYLKVWQSWMS
jgi:predicted TIM-barrel fold metal-dependent hydrolase